MNVLTPGNELGSGDYAARKAYDLTYSGYSDWYLPSKDELLLIKDTLYDYGYGLWGDSFGQYKFWTSTEYSLDPVDRASYYNFDANTFIVPNKDYLDAGVIAVREFSIDPNQILPAGTTNDILYHNGTEWSVLGEGDNGEFLGVSNNNLGYYTPAGTGTITGVTAGSLLDGGGTTGTVTLNVDLSEASSDNTFANTDELIYLTGTTQKRGTVSGLQTYMQNSLDFTDGYWEDNTTYYRTTNVDRDIRLLGQDLEIYESTGTFLGLELTSTQSHELIFKDASFQPLRLYGDLVYLKNGGGVSEFSTDGTLAGNSDTAIPTEKAVKTYVDNNSTALKSTVPQSITTTADCTNYLNFYTTASSDKTITFTNVDDGDTGNIEVIYSGSSEITIAESITEVTIIKIAPNIEGTASNKIITKSSGEATYSYWRRGSRLYIVGTQF